MSCCNPFYNGRTKPISVPENNYSDTRNMRDKYDLKEAKQELSREDLPLSDLGKVVQNQGLLAGVKRR